MASPQIAFILILIVFVAYGMYSTYKKQKQVLIIYHRVTGQVLEKFATLSDRTVDIDGKRFIVMPDRHFLLLWDRGIHSFFRTWVIGYEFSYYSRYPHDPKNFKDTVVSPAVAKVLNNEDRMKSFARGVQSQVAGKKGGAFEKYLPYILVAVMLVLIVLYFRMNGQIGALTKAVQGLMNTAPK